MNVLCAGFVMPKIILLPGNRFCLEDEAGRRSHAVPFDQMLIWEEVWLAHTNYYGADCVAQLSNYRQCEVVDKTIED